MYNDNKANKKTKACPIIANNIVAANGNMVDILFTTNANIAPDKAIPNSIIWLKMSCINPVTPE